MRLIWPVRATRLLAPVLALVASPNDPEKVALRELAEATPERSEALVGVRTISINRGEVNRLATAADGWRPGWDIAGVVLSAAADGTGPPVGSRVVGLSNFGGWCERLVIPASQLAVIPDSVSFASAAALPVAGLTALRTLRLGGLLLDRRVLVTGASGGVGRFALQLGSASGALVTAVVGSAERGAGLEALGATEVVLGIEKADGRFHLILEAAGGPSLAAALGKVAAGGTVVTFGNSAKEATSFMTNDFYFQGASLRGFFLLGDWHSNPSGVDLGLLLAQVALGRLDPQVSLELPWTEAAAALRELRERRLPGKAVLHL